MKPIDWQRVWFPQWPLGEVALRAAAVYLFVFLLMRAVGRKELGRYANFDIALLMLITVAARQSIVGNDSSLTSAFVALAVIFGLDWLLSRAA